MFLRPYRRMKEKSRGMQKLFEVRFYFSCVCIMCLLKKCFTRALMVAANGWPERGPKGCALGIVRGRLFLSIENKVTILFGIIYHCSKFNVEFNCRFIPL